MEGKNRTKIWFQGFSRRLKNSNNCLEDQESHSASLPPELVESILEWITDDCYTLLRCRLVCYQWKHIADSLLERRRLSLLTNWDSSLSLNTKLLMPYVFAVRPSNSHTIRLILPSHFKRKSLEEDPFPHNSIAVEFQNHHWQRLRSPLKRRVKVDLLEFITQTGRFLTSLILIEVKVSEKDLITILETVPFLKCILFSGVSVREENCVMRKVPVNIYRHLQLTHLHLINCRGKQLKRSFLPLLSNHLVSLKIRRDIEHLSLEKKRFENLRKLYILEVHAEDLMELLKKTKYPPQLEYLALTYDRHTSFDDTEDRRVRFTEVLMNFVSKMSGSLIFLRFDGHWNTLQQYLDETKVIFPNVTSLQIGLIGTVSTGTIWKDMVSPAFPKIQSIQFPRSTTWGSVVNYEGCQILKHYEIESFIPGFKLYKSQSFSFPSDTDLE